MQQLSTHLGSHSYVTWSCLSRTHTIGLSQSWDRGKGRLIRSVSVSCYSSANAELYLLDLLTTYRPLPTSKSLRGSECQLHRSEWKMTSRIGRSTFSNDRAYSSMSFAVKSGLNSQDLASYSTRGAVSLYAEPLRELRQSVMKRRKYLRTVAVGALVSVRLTWKKPRTLGCNALQTTFALHFTSHFWILLPCCRRRVKNVS